MDPPEPPNPQKFIEEIDKLLKDDEKDIGALGKMAKEVKKSLEQEKKTNTVQTSISNIVEGVKLALHSYNKAVSSGKYQDLHVLARFVMIVKENLIPTLSASLAGEIYSDVVSIALKLKVPWDPDGDILGLLHNISNQVVSYKFLSLFNRNAKSNSERPKRTGKSGLGSRHGAVSFRQGADKALGGGSLQQMASPSTGRLENTSITERDKMYVTSSLFKMFAFYLKLVENVNPKNHMYSLSTTNIEALLKFVVDQRNEHSQNERDQALLRLFFVRYFVSCSFLSCIDSSKMGGESLCVSELFDLDEAKDVYTPHPITALGCLVKMAALDPKFEDLEYDSRLNSLYFTFIIKLLASSDTILTSSFCAKIAPQNFGLASYPPPFQPLDLVTLRRYYAYTALYASSIFRHVVRYASNCILSLNFMLSFTEKTFLIRNSIVHFRLTTTMLTRGKAHIDNGVDTEDAGEVIGGAEDYELPLLTDNNPGSIYDGFSSPSAGQLDSERLRCSCSGMIVEEDPDGDATVTTNNNFSLSSSERSQHICSVLGNGDVRMKGQTGPDVLYYDNNTETKENGVPPQVSLSSTQTQKQERSGPFQRRQKDKDKDKDRQRIGKQRQGTTKAVVVVGGKVVDDILGDTPGDLVPPLATLPKMERMDDESGSRWSPGNSSANTQRRVEREVTEADFVLDSSASYVEYFDELMKTKDRLNVYTLALANMRAIRALLSSRQFLWDIVAEVASGRKPLVDMFLISAISKITETCFARHVEDMESQQSGSNCFHPSGNVTPMSASYTQGQIDDGGKYLFANGVGPGYQMGRLSSTHTTTEAGYYNFKNQEKKGDAAEAMTTLLLSLDNMMETENLFPLALLPIHYMDGLIHIIPPTGENPAAPFMSTSTQTTPFSHQEASPSPTEGGNWGHKQKSFDATMDEEACRYVPYILLDTYIVLQQLINIAVPRLMMHSQMNRVALNTAERLLDAILIPTLEGLKNIQTENARCRFSVLVRRSNYNAITMMAKQLASLMSTALIFSSCVTKLDRNGTTNTQGMPSSDGDMPSSNGGDSSGPTDSDSCNNNGSPTATGDQCFNIRNIVEKIIKLLKNISLGKIEIFYHKRLSNERSDPSELNSDSQGLEDIYVNGRSYLQCLRSVKHLKVSGRFLIDSGLVASVASSLLLLCLTSLEHLSFRIWRYTLLTVSAAFYELGLKLKRTNSGISFSLFVFENSSICSPEQRLFGLFPMLFLTGGPLDAATRAFEKFAHVVDAELADASTRQPKESCDRGAEVFGKTLGELSGEAQIAVVKFQRHFDHFVDYALALLTALATVGSSATASVASGPTPHTKIFIRSRRPAKLGKHIQVQTITSSTPTTMALGASSTSTGASTLCMSTDGMFKTPVESPVDVLSILLTTTIKRAPMFLVRLIWLLIEKLLPIDGSIQQQEPLRPECVHYGDSPSQYTLLPFLLENYIKTHGRLPTFPTRSAGARALRRIAFVVAKAGKSICKRTRGKETTVLSAADLDTSGSVIFATLKGTRRLMFREFEEQHVPDVLKPIVDISRCCSLSPRVLSFLFTKATNYFSPSHWRIFSGVAVSLGRGTNSLKVLISPLIARMGIDSLVLLADSLLASFGDVPGGFEDQDSTKEVAQLLEAIAAEVFLRLSLLTESFTQADDTKRAPPNEDEHRLADMPLFLFVRFAEAILTSRSPKTRRTLSALVAGNVFDYLFSPSDNQLRASLAADGCAFTTTVRPLSKSMQLPDTHEGRWALVLKILLLLYFRALHPSTDTPCSSDDSAYVSSHLMKIQGMFIMLFTSDEAFSSPRAINTATAVWAYHVLISKLAVTTDNPQHPNDFDDQQLQAFILRNTMKFDINVVQQAPPLFPAEAVPGIPTHEFFDSHFGSFVDQVTQNDPSFEATVEAFKTTVSEQELDVMDMYAAMLETVPEIVFTHDTVHFLHFIINRLSVWGSGGPHPPVQFYDLLRDIAFALYRKTKVDKADGFVLILKLIAKLYLLAPYSISSPDGYDELTGGVETAPSPEAARMRLFVGFLKRTTSELSDISSPIDSFIKASCVVEFQADIFKDLQPSAKLIVFDVVVRSMSDIYTICTTAPTRVAGLTDHVLAKRNYDVRLRVVVSLTELFTHMLDTLNSSTIPSSDNAIETADTSDTFQRTEALVLCVQEYVEFRSPFARHGISNSKETYPPNSDEFVERNQLDSVFVSAVFTLVGAVVSLLNGVLGSHRDTDVCAVQQLERELWRRCLEEHDPAVLSSRVKVYLSLLGETHSNIERCCFDGAYKHIMELVRGYIPFNRVSPNNNNPLCINILRTIIHMTVPAVKFHLFMSGSSRQAKYYSSLPPATRVRVHLFRIVDMLLAFTTDPNNLSDRQLMIILTDCQKLLCKELHEAAP